MTIEVIETTNEVIEVIEAGPRGSAGQSITSRVIVEELSDFPVPILGKINLVPTQEYFITEDVPLGLNEIVYGVGSTIGGNSKGVLTYDGTGTMFSSLDTSLTLRSIDVSCANGKLLDAEDSAGNEGSSTVYLQNVTVRAANKLGTMTNISAYIHQSVTFANVVSGLDFIGEYFNTIAGHFYSVEMLAGTGIAFNLGSCKSNTILFNDQSIILNAGTTFISGAIDSGNLNAGGIGLVSFTSLMGSGTSLDGIVYDDDLWEFVSNNTIKNTNRDRLNNQVIINKKEDFPDAVAGVIPLVRDKEYVIGDCDIDVSPNRFALAPNVTFSGAPGASCISSNYAGNIFSGGDLGIFTLRGMLMDFPNGDVLTISDTVPGSTTINLIDSRITSCNSFGSVEDTLGLTTSLFSVIECNKGLTVIGDNQVISISQTAFFSTSASFIGVDLGTSVTPTMEISNLLCVAPAGGVGISGGANSVNISAGSVASISSCEFLGGMDTLGGGLSADDVRFNFIGNSGIANTNPDALTSSQNNLLVTSIVSQGTAEKVNAVYIEASASHFTTDSSGRVTYVGENDVAGPIDILSGLLANTGNTEGAIAVAINGTEVARGIPVSLSTSKQAQSSAIWQHTFSTGDYVEAYVVNTGGTQDLIAGTVYIRIR